MSGLDPELPPVGEEIHLPGPSKLPILTAVGTTFLVIGISTIHVLSVFGFILMVVCIVLWIKDTRRETNELPLDGGHH
jgi:maltodextrin utilization protein YvdJ